MSGPPFDNWVLAYVVSYNKETDWPEGFILDMDENLKKRGWMEPGHIIGSDWDLVNHKPRVGLAYYEIFIADNSDLPCLTNPHYVWIPT